MGVQILNGIWLGNVSDIMNVKYCLNKDIKTIIYCSRDGNDYEHLAKYNIELVKIPISNFDKSFNSKYNDELFDHISDVIKFMHKKYVNYTNILLACEDGIQISPSFMCAFLINYGNMNVENAIESLKSKNENYFSDECYYTYALNKFYYRLHNQ